MAVCVRAGTLVNGLSVEVLSRLTVCLLEPTPLDEEEEGSFKSSSERVSMAAGRGVQSPDWGRLSRGRGPCVDWEGNECGSNPFVNFTLHIFVHGQGGVKGMREGGRGCGVPSVDAGRTMSIAFPETGMFISDFVSSINIEGDCLPF